MLSNVTLQFLSINAAPKPSVCIDNLALATFIGRTERGFDFRFKHLFGAREQRRSVKMTPREETVRRRSPAAPLRLADRKPTLRVAVRRTSTAIFGMAAGV